MNLTYLASALAAVAGVGLSTLAGTTAVASPAPWDPAPCQNCQQTPGDIGGPGNDVPLQDPPKMGGGPESGGRSYAVPGQSLQDRAPAGFTSASGAA